MTSTLIPTPKLGEVVTGSFAPHQDTSSDDTSTVTSSAGPGRLRIVNWNCERGYEIERIIKHLEQVNADIVILQELDWGCERTDNKVIVHEVARALKMHYTFTVEFEELYSEKYRTKHLQGGGVHGNAILSRWELSKCRAYPHDHNPYRWDKEGHKRGEPRNGRRVVSVATVNSPYGAIDVYSVHFENFAGILDRVAQFDEVRDLVREVPDGCVAQVIAGDFNTLMSGLARWQVWDHADDMRWQTLGQSEAMWWWKNVLGGYGPADGPTHVPRIRDAVYVDDDGVSQPALWDPFDKKYDVTLSKLGGFYAEKLDWILSRGLNIHEKNIDGENLSDHYCLWVDVSVST